MPEKKITPTNPAGQPPETAQHNTKTAVRKTAPANHKFRKAARKAARKTAGFIGWSDRGLKDNVVAVTW